MKRVFIATTLLLLSFSSFANYKLHKAVTDKNLKAVMHLIAHDNTVNLNYIDENGYPLLVHAAYSSNAEIVLALIDAGADVNKKNRQGIAPIVAALYWQTPEVISALLAAGANVNSTNNNGWIPLFSADNSENVELLVAGGANIDYQDPDGGETALHLRALWGYAEVIRTLVAAGANPNIQNDKGQTPLIIAVQERNLDATLALIDANPDFSIKQNYNKETALTLAVKYWIRPEFAFALIDANAALDEQNADGDTALIIAAKKSRFELVEALVAAGADLNKKNKKRKTALKIAKRNKDWDIVALLREAGAK